MFKQIKVVLLILIVSTTIPLDLERTQSKTPLIKWVNNGTQLLVLFEDEEGLSVRIWSVYGASIEEVEETPYIRPVGSFSRFAKTSRYYAEVVDDMVLVYELSTPDYFDMRRFIGTAYGKVSG